MVLSLLLLSSVGAAGRFRWQSIVGFPLSYVAKVGMHLILSTPTPQLHTHTAS